MAATRWMMALALCSAIALILGGQDPYGTEPVKELTFTWLSAGLGVGALWILFTHNNLVLSWRNIVFLALAVRVISIQAWPLLEDDYFRYLWDGRQTLLTGSPWQYPPEAFFSDTHLPQQWQWVLNQINYPELPTLYGPVLQYLFALACLIKPADLTTLQVLLLLVDIGILISLYYMKTPLRWLTAYAIHPLILKEAMASAHPDLLMALGLLWALYHWQQQRPALLGLALGFALGAKISALLVLPFLLMHPTSQTLRDTFFWSRRVIGSAGLTLLCLYLPLLHSLDDGSEWTSLSVFAQTWQFNPLLYRGIEALFTPANARFVSAIFLLTSLSVLFFYWLRFPRKQTRLCPPPLDIALLCLLLFSPVVNGWYWLWLLPLAIYLQRLWLVLGCCIAPLAYFNSSVITLPGHEDIGLFFVPTWITALQLLLLSFLIWFHKRLPAKEAL